MSVLFKLKRKYEASKKHILMFGSLCFLLLVITWFRYLGSSSLEVVKSISEEIAVHADMVKKEDTERKNVAETMTAIEDHESSHPNTERKVISFASYYSSHMVLQKAPARTRIWGYASHENDTITITLGGKSPVITVTQNGIWKAELPPMEAGGPFTIRAISSIELVEVTLEDVLFGDVWLCSGGSNMQMTMAMVTNSTAELYNLKQFKDIRVFTVGYGAAPTSQADFEEIVHSWSEPTKEIIGKKEYGSFSALCWLYGVELRRTLKYPIGLIASSRGGTRVEAWSSPEALSVCKSSDVKRDVREEMSPILPSSVWNSMVHPLLSLAIYGVIWYQGEANAYDSSADIYNCTFPAMIDDWRLKFSEASNRQTDPMFPFGFVQLATNEKEPKGRTRFPDMRWHQTADFGYVPNARMKNVFMAVTMDLPDFDDNRYGSIHPRYKLEVAKRLARAGLAVAYNMDVGRYQAPIPTNFISFKGFGSLGIEFDRSNGHIQVKSKEGFEVCCSSRHTDLHCEEGQWIDTPIVFQDNNRITLSCRDKCNNKHIVGVRYAWKETPCEFKNCAIYSKENNLPAPAFIKMGNIEGGIYTEDGDEPSLSFASYYTCHMVLQKAPAKNYIWGYATPDYAKVTVTLSGRSPLTTVVKDGLWKVQLLPEESGGPFTLTATSSIGNKTVELVDILFGDVWICSGQSNMEMTMNMEINANEELKDLNYPNIRVFTIGRSAATNPQTDLLQVLHPWSLPTKDVIGRGDFHSFSAVCWLYGKLLHKRLKYPIGLISSSWGGTPVEAWSSRDTLSRCNITDIHLKDHRSPTALWNSMMYPLLNLTIYGVIWYQGEDNGFRPEFGVQSYSCTFPAMIDAWRRKFHEGTGGQTDQVFPFGFVQLAPFRGDPSISKPYPDIRWHQTANYGYVPNERMKNVFMAVAVDLPDYNHNPYGSIHPRYKQDIAYRLYLSALKLGYHINVGRTEGPFPSRYYPNGANLTIEYGQQENIQVMSKDGFEVCCTTEKQYTCDFNRKGNRWKAVPIISYDDHSITLSTNDECMNKILVGVRYAWRESPCPLKKCAIYSVENNLPAPPFVSPII